MLAMRISFNRFLGFEISRLCIAIPLVLLPVRAYCQEPFDKAHELLKEGAQAQGRVQQQKPSEAELKRLKEVTNSVAQTVPELLKKGVLELLNLPARHTADELSAKLRTTLQVIPQDQYQPEVFVFPLALHQADSYLVAYNVSYCASCSYAWIGVVGRKDGRYSILSEEDHSFANKTLHVAPLGVTDRGAARFLIYGTNWGDAHNRLSLVAYVLDDGRLRRFWARTDLPQGSIRVTPTRISLSFLTALRPPWSERTEVYTVQQGEEIKLQQSSERPNP